MLDWDSSVFKTNADMLDQFTPQFWRLSARQIKKEIGNEGNLLCFWEFLKHASFFNSRLCGYYF
jgi:hypothetical protein